MSEITIKVGNIVLNASNSDLVSVDETPDGVSFSFKGGLQLLFTDPYMPSSAKQIVKNTADNMGGKKMVFELDNPKRPAMVDAT
jgi:hypothetical protein